MTKINFYILPQDDEESRLIFTCRLIEKIFNMGHKIYCHTHDEASATQIDELLWKFRPESFLPHALINNPQEQSSPIHIGWHNDPKNHHEILINLSTQIPDFFSRFDKVTEIVCQRPEQLESSRNNWKFYQDRGYPLQLHKI